MQLEIRKHIMPVTVTCVGLAVAASLALAPAMMADDATDIQTAANTTDIANLTEQMGELSAAMEARVTELEGSLSGRISSLEVQVITLNKAVKRMHVKLNLSTAAADREPEALLSSDDMSALKSSDSNQGLRIDTVEKAVFKLHKRVMSMTDEVEERNAGMAEIVDVKRKFGALIQSLSQ